MSRRALVVFAALALPLAPASATGARRRHVTVPKTSASDAQAFDQTYEMVFLLAGRSYLKNELMPDPDSLDPLIAPLLEPQRGKAQEKKDRLGRLVSGAECVQNGPAGTAPEVYRLLVGQAAEDLQVGMIVEQDFVPNARSGRSLDADEKALVKDCQGEARNQAYDRRGFYQKCLGRRRSEAVYLAPERLAQKTSQQPPGTECGQVLEAVAQSRAKLPAGLSDDVSRKLQQTQELLLSGSRRTTDAPPGASPSRQARFGVPAASGRKPDMGGASAKTPSDLKLTEPPLNSADLTTGAKLAGVAKADEIGFTGYCYSYVKSALQKLGIVDKSAIASAGAAEHAKLFADFVDKNPALLKRKLRRIPQPSWPVPIGTIVVWSAGACGYSAKSGHIEIVTRIKPPQACSDGCGTFQTACLDELGSDPPRAAAELSKAQEELAQTQAAYDSGHNSARLAALRKKKAALAAVSRRLEPQVAAYIIERDR